MSDTATARMPVASEALVAERARRLVADGVAKVLVLRAQPRWRGPSELTIDGARVLVRAAVSQLAALDALAERTPEDYLVLLSDQSDTDLGDAVLVRAEHQRIEPLDEWGAVPALYGAHRIDPALRRCGGWVPGALLDHQPPGGWPRVTAGVVSADHALGNLLGAVLQRELPVRWDLVALLDALEAPASRASWQAAPALLRAELSRWAASAIDAAAELALAAAARGPVSPTAIGLALDVLWPAEEGAVLDAEQGAARGRIESRLTDQQVPPAAARSYALAARALLLRLDESGAPAVPQVLAQAEALLADLRWPAGAERSTVLPSGLRARYRSLAGLLTEDTVEALVRSLPRVEGALGDVVAHDRADRDLGVLAARMAVRLVRWLDRQRGGKPVTSLGAALQQYLHDGAWADHAAAVVWEGSADEAVAAGYQALWRHVRTVRDAQDAVAAQLLAQATERDETPGGAVLIERALEDVVWPSAGTLRPLVILLDGMSGPVAVELAEAIVRSGHWRELIPQAGSQRLPLLAALPTLTRFSRTAFFTGELTAGAQAAETKAVRQRFDAPLFHKDDLRSGAGDALSPVVRAAIADESARMVAVVLNTIDDALDKHDPGGTRWGVQDVRYLPALLSAAAEAGRAVVLTSDHGHVVERGSEARTAAGRSEARWRTDGPAGEGEVLLQGRRVVPGGEAVLAWREDLRYTSLRSGYHGGGSLAEITVPLVVLARPGQKVAPGWREAAPQAPVWWNEAQRPAEAGPRRRQRTERPAPTVAPSAAPPVPDEGQGVLGFQVPEVPVASKDAGDGSGGLGAALERTEAYARQRRQAGRRALDHDKVAVALEVLAAHGGRAHRDTLATAMGIPASSWPATQAALTRLLNIESYGVIRAEGDVVVLDEALLREQFEIGGPRG